MMDPKITIYRHCKDTEPMKQLPLSAVLAGIRAPSKRVIEIVARCRAEPDKKARRATKEGLPAVTFAVQMNHRRGGDAADKIAARSGVVCLDFDGLPDLAATRAKISADPRVLAHFISPSGDGLKVITRTTANMEDTWRGMADYFASTHGIAADEARKDLVGLCFVSHDPEIYVAPDWDMVLPFDAPKTEQAEQRKTDGEVLEDYADARAAAAPLGACDPDCDYAAWIEIGQALHCQFRGGQDGLTLWDEWSRRGGKYAGQKDLETHWRSFHGGGVTFRSVLKRAYDAGWVKPGKPAKKVQQTPPVVTGTALRDMLKAQINGAYKLEAWPWPCLTQRSRSLLPGSVTIVCGSPGAGKTWFIMQCMRFWAQQNVACATLMLEENTAWHMHRCLALITGGTDLLCDDWVRSNPDTTMEAEARHADEMAPVERMLTCQGNLTLAACVDWVEKQCDAGKRIILIDPITLADPGNDKSWDADRKFIQRAQTAIGKTGASLVLVTHPRKGSSHNKGPMTLDDLAGGAAYQRAAASALWLLGLENVEDTPVVDADGQYSTQTAHKVIRIQKARNSSGQHAQVAFRVHRMNMVELGVIASQQTSRAGPSRAAKLKASPSPEEDQFA